MKRFLLPLLAALALPTAVNAESYWLIVFLNASTSQKIEMNSMEQCKEPVSYTHLTLPTNREV